MTEAFVLLRVHVASQGDAELASAEAWAAGASGCEEREAPNGRALLLIYAPASRATAVRTAVASRLAGRGRLDALTAVAHQDWSRSWRAWHRPCVVSPRLAIRPSFASLPSVPGQRVLVLDPGQAFGTGAHASTRLVLELLCGPLLAELPGTRVLDAGVGSGVLALSALLLGAEGAVGFDLDRLATSEARAHARCNGLESRLRVFTGPIEALGPGRFDLVLANLLRRELEPILPLLCPRVAAGGSLVLSGLLEADVEALRPQLARLSFTADAECRRRDDVGDTWYALSARR